MRLEYIKQMMRCGNEVAACCIIEVMLETNDGRQIEAMGWPRVIRWEREFPLPRGRADFVLFHADGSITVIEVKRGDRPFNEILEGIGQVSMYAVQLGYSRTATSIRKVLAATATPLLFEEACLSLACDTAGVEYMPLGKLTELQALWEAAAVPVEGGA